MKSFAKQLRDFYPEYLEAHSDTNNKVLHFIGASTTIALLITSLYLHEFWLIIIAIIIGYLLPGIGHRHFQKNASFRGSRPILCVICAFFMYLDLLTGNVKFK